jgi:hypothetical protein
VTTNTNFNGNAKSRSFDHGGSIALEVNPSGSRRRGRALEGAVSPVWTGQRTQTLHSVCTS